MSYTYKFGQQRNWFLTENGVHTTRFLKYVWTVFNIVHKRVKTYFYFFCLGTGDQDVEFPLKYNPKQSTF